MGARVTSVVTPLRIRSGVTVSDGLAVTGGGSGGSGGTSGVKLISAGVSGRGGDGERKGETMENLQTKKLPSSMKNLNERVSSTAVVVEGYLPCQ